MKLAKISHGLLLGLTLLLAASASAASKGSVSLNDDVTVSGMRLAKGNYRIEWQGTGPEVDLTFIKSGKVVTTVPARLLELNRKGEYQGYGTRKQDDGSISLTDIYFSGQKYRLAIGPESPATQSTKAGS